MRIRIQAGKQRSLLSKMAFSMVEMLVAMAVLGIMFVSLYSGFSAGFAIIELARENLRATQILQEKMETIRLYTWDQINTAGFIPTNFVEAFYAVGTNTNVTGITYTGRVTIAAAPISTSYSNELKSVNIRVSWRSAGVNRNREMTTLVTRNGLQNYIY
jgi:prepilin-type N-terminal cleavage/methylation domain-containing protein